MSGLCIKKTMEVSIETLVEATVTELAICVILDLVHLYSLHQRLLLDWRWL